MNATLRPTVAASAWMSASPTLASGVPTWTR
jgi:hypothetical protein